VIAKNSPTGRIHKPGDFWENQPLTGRSPGLPGEIAGLNNTPPTAYKRYSKIMHDN